MCKVRFSKVKYAELPRASPLGPPPQLCPGPNGVLTALCRSPANFFMSLVWEKTFGLLQTQFETQKWWYDKVLGKTSALSRLSKFMYLGQSSQRYLRCGIDILQFASNFGRDYWKNQIMKISTEYLFPFRFYGILNFQETLSFWVFSNFLEFKNHFLDFPVVPTIGQFVSSWYAQKALRNWENQTFRFAWENFTGVRNLKKCQNWIKKKRLWKFLDFWSVISGWWLFQSVSSVRTGSTLGRLYKTRNLKTGG